MSGPRTLVVGGTGMLRQAVLALAREGPVTLVARNPGAVKADGVVLLAIDYRKTAAFEAALAAAGPFDRCVAWIRSDAPEALRAAMGATRGPFFHVLGNAGEPLPPADGYHVVILGSMEEGGRTRWLTDGEISAGVLEAIASGRPRTLVGSSPRR